MLKAGWKDNSSILCFLQELRCCKGCPYKLSLGHIAAAEKCASWNEKDKYRINLLPSQCCLSTSFFNVTKVSGISMSAWCQPSYLLPICGFGSAFWSDTRISQSVIKHQPTVWCLWQSNSCQRKKGSNVGRDQFGSLFQRFFAFFLGIRYGDRRMGSRFLGPVSIRQD